MTSDFFEITQSTPYALMRVSLFYFNRIVKLFFIYYLFIGFTVHRYIHNFYNVLGLEFVVRVQFNCLFVSGEVGELGVSSFRSEVSVKVR